MLLVVGQWMERGLRDEARRAWFHWLGGNVPEARPSWVQAFRNSRAYQRFVQVLKWHLLPDWVITPLTVVVLCWILFAAYVQATLPFLENGTLFCQPSSDSAPEIASVSRDFSPRDVCSESFGWVREGDRYVVTFDVLDPWYDASLATTPEGLSAGEFPWGLGYIAGPLKRVIDARYLQPVLEIRPTGKERDETGGNIQIYPLAVRQVGDSRTLFRADFSAPRSGELFLFVNDAMLPFKEGEFNYRYFYEASGTGDASTLGNRGSACVTVESVETNARSVALPPPASICQKTALRSRGQL
jgi:hypothetical protein